MSPLRALALGAVGLALQILVLMPAVDHAVAENAALHYVQHGVIFAGGLMMGVALRDLMLARRRSRL